jgi:hypothetical protein
VVAVKPYYSDESVTLYHADCREVLPSLDRADHVLADPPYDAETHAGARTLALEPRTRASDGRRGIVASAALGIDFDALPEVGWTASLWQYARRWCLVFCSIEMLGDYRRQSSGAWVRGGIWRRPDGAPQISGDRPAQPAEGIAILHRAGAKRWNGGGHHAFYDVGVVRVDRVHPTQKPDRLIERLVEDFTDPGELILDPYAGSGTTGVAAKRLGRRAILIELEEKYCEIAARRLMQSAFSDLWIPPDPKALTGDLLAADPEAGTDTGVKR